MAVIPGDQRPLADVLTELERSQGRLDIAQDGHTVAALVCELHVGTPARAYDQLERCLTTLNASRDQVQRGIIGTDLAIARLRAGDVRSAPTLLHDCVDTTAATGGRVAAQRIGRARRELAPWRTKSFVAELDNHIYECVSHEVITRSTTCIGDVPWGSPSPHARQVRYRRRRATG